VLVVDDDPVCRMFCVHALTAAGYPVFVAIDGKSAINNALSGQPGVVLTDLHLPDISGTEAMSRVLESWPSGKAFPKFIALSGDDSAMEYADPSCPRFDFFLTKPFSAEALLACIGECAGNPAASHESLATRCGGRHVARTADERQSAQAALRTAFCLELSRQLPELDALVTALEWETAAKILHRLTGASALAGFVDFAHQGQLLLLHLSRENLSHLAECYPDFLLQAARLTQTLPAIQKRRVTHSE